MSLTDRSARRAPGGPTPTGSGASAGSSAPTASGASAPRELVVLALLVAAFGVVARFWTSSPLWLDEALSVNIATLPLGDIPDALRQDGHPPLYYVLLHGWTEVFGTGDEAVRALSGLFAVATLPLAWLAGRRRGGPVLGWLTLLVVAVAPFALRYATETRMYALVMFLALAGWLLVDRAVHGGDGIGTLVGIGAITAGLLYSHYWAMWLVAAGFAVVGWCAWRATDDEMRARSRKVLVAAAVGCLAFLPWLPVLFDQARTTGTPWAGPQRPTSIVASTLTDFGGGDFKDAELVGAVLFVLALLGLFGQAIDGRRIELDLRTQPQLRPEACLVGLALGLGALVSYLTWSAYATRYAAVVFPFIALLVAGGLSRFTDRWVRDGAAVVLTGLCLIGAAYQISGQRTQARNIGEAVAANASPGDVVVYCPDQLGPAGSREMPADIRQVVYPTLDGPERVDWRDYEARNAASDPATFVAEVDELAGDGRVFLVWSPSYATFEGRCEAVLAGLADVRPGPSTLVAEDGADYYEHAELTVFPGRA
jgi:mannosyltransferase